jgi:hypothetical protein
MRNSAFLDTSSAGASFLVLVKSFDCFIPFILTEKREFGKELQTYSVKQRYLQKGDISVKMSLCKK